MSVITKFKDIKAFIFDVDGVLTDNFLLITESGDYLRRMNTRDGYAIVRAIKAGYHICIMTGGNSKGVVSRLKKLGCQDVFSGLDFKVEKFQEWIINQSFGADEVLYMGDDVIDSYVMKEVYIAASPADGVPEVKAVADYISPIKGGHGCVRDVIEKVMRSKGEW